jgi:hypothetical protein
MPRAYAIFISHSHELDYVNAMKLSAMLQECPRFTLIDKTIFAVQRLTDDVKPVIEEKIKQSDVLILLSRPVIGRSNWIKFEIETARNHGVPIIAVPSPGVEALSQVARKYANRTVRWNGNDIVRAIRALSQNRKPPTRLPIVTAAPESLPEVFPTILPASPTVAPSPVASPRAPLPVSPHEDTAWRSSEIRKPGFLSRLFGWALTP